MEHNNQSFLFSQEPTSDLYSENLLVLYFQVSITLVILAKQLTLKNGAVFINLCMTFRGFKKKYNNALPVKCRPHEVLNFAET
jgi:hypothetical protein